MDRDSFAAEAGYSSEDRWGARRPVFALIIALLAVLLLCLALDSVTTADFPPSSVEPIAYLSNEPNR